MDSAIVDAIGHAHAPVEATPRIVSLVPSITELICELGLTGQLVGRTGFCIHPGESVRHIAKVGGTKDVDLDKVRALNPTHVVVNIDENRRETADALRRFVPNVIVTHPNAPQDNIALYRLLGGIFRREPEAHALIERFEVALAACRDGAREFPAERVLYLIWRDPWMTVSRDTYISRTLALVGWETVEPAIGPTTAAGTKAVEPTITTAAANASTGAHRYPEIALDDALLACIDRMLLSSEPYRFRDHHVAELSVMPALRDKPVSLIDGEMTSWYGSRAIRGLEYLPALRRSLV